MAVLKLTWLLMVVMGLQLPHSLDCLNPAFAHIRQVVVPRTEVTTQADTVAQLIQRVLGDRSSEFTVIVDSSIGPRDKDTFKLVSGNNSQVTITGTSGVAASMGFYYYLTQFGGGQVSWAGSQVNLPSPLPKVPAPGVTITSNDKFRYYLNTCTMSYSFVWFDWPSWEHQIDWMAMHGINLPLAFVGQEAIWQRVYLQLGFSQDDLDAFFAGPAFLAWQRMGNIVGWGGPLPQSWIKNQMALQHEILKRMRDFGMTPVLPAFAGHVPQSIVRLFPNASVTQGGDWGGFIKPYCCSTLLDFSDPLFVKIGESFLKEYTHEFGTDHVYNCDSFNENTPPKGDPEFIASAGRQVYKGMSAADPNAIWLMQGWLFSHEPTYWTPTLAAALLTAVPKGRMIILDMPSDTFPQYARLSSYFGQPFIWTMLHNFGGTDAMYGILPNISTGPFVARNLPHSTMVGVGLTMEGINQNEVMYEFMMEHAWRKTPADISKWITNYHHRRYGQFSPDVDTGWQILKSTVYNCTDPAERHAHGKNLIIMRPRRHLRIDVWYDPNELYLAWDHFVKAAHGLNKSELFRYDLVDVSRQCLQVLAIKYYTDLNVAFTAKNLTQTMSSGAALVDLLLDLNTLLGTDRHFLLGPWLESAKEKATTDEERALYEFNARNQITLWGPNGNILDYANKQWEGLMADYYALRWKLYVTILIDLLQTGNAYNRTVVNQRIFREVEEPFTSSTKLYPTRPTGGLLDVVKYVHTKYRPVMTQHSEFFSKLPQWSRMDGKFSRDASRWTRKQMRKKHNGNQLFNSFNSKVEATI